MLHMHTGHLNEVFAMPHQGANFAYGVFGTKRGPQQANRMQILKPLTIQHVRLAAGNVMDMLSIDQMDFNATRFQDLKQWYPVHPGGFHSHRVQTTLLQPVRQSMKILGKGGKRSNRFCIAIGGDGDKNLRRSDVDTTGIRSHHRQAPLQFAILPFLLGHGSSPFIRFGNEPGVQEMKSLKRDHHNTNCGCASPMLLRTGLGSNSSTGSPKQAPLGTRPTLTAAVSDFLAHIRDSIGPDPSNGKFLTVIVWPQDSWDTPLRGGECSPPGVERTCYPIGGGVPAAGEGWGFMGATGGLKYVRAAAPNPTVHATYSISTPAASKGRAMKFSPKTPTSLATRRGSSRATIPKMVVR